MQGFHLAPLMLLATCSMLGDVWADDEPTADRSAWHFTNEDVVATIKLQEDGSWIGIRNDGRRPVYDQIEVTDEYIMLQNRDTQLFLRLHGDWGYWKRPSDEDWTQWTQGEWTASGFPEPLGEHRIRVAYFVPTDRTPADGYEQRIRNIMTVVSDLYQYSLSNQGYDFDGLSFEQAEGEVVVHLIQGPREATYYNNGPQHSETVQWERVSHEIGEQLGNTDEQLIVVFTECFGNGQSQFLWPGTIARGERFTTNGGMVMYSAHLLRGPFAVDTLGDLRALFFDQTPVRGRRVMGHRANTPRCEFIEDGIGAIAHELGHALGLVDDHRQDDLDLMGNGFRNLRWNLDPQERRKVVFSEENARLLMSSRYIADDLDLEDNEPPMVEVERLSANASSQLILVRASDNTGLRAIVFKDTQVGSIVEGQRLNGTEQEVRQRLPLNGTGGFPIALEVIVTDNGGHQTRVRLTETDS